jgi:AcrR family transcriptional regulator
MPPEELRQKVLDAATRVFAEAGYDDTTSDRIAELAGIPRPTIYRMFGSKQEVFVAAVDRALQRIVEYQTRSMATTTHLHGRSIASVNVGAFLQLVRDEPDTVRMLQLADSSGAGGTRGAAAAIRRRIEQATAAYIRATWEGKVPLSDSEAALGARLTVAVVESGAAHYLENRDFSIDEITDYLSNFIRTGFTHLRSREG